MGGVFEGYGVVGEGEAEGIVEGEGDGEQGFEIGEEAEGGVGVGWGRGLLLMVIVNGVWLLAVGCRSGSRSDHGGWGGDGIEEGGKEVSKGGDVGVEDGSELFEEREGTGFPGVERGDCRCPVDIFGEA